MKKYLLEIKNKGISLRHVNIVMLVIALLISAVLVFAMNRTNELYEVTSEANDDLIVWRSSAYDLQIASDYLTDQMRSFVITGDRTYLDNYIEEAYVTKRRDKALDILERNLADTKPVITLAQAMDVSMKLMDREYYSARLALAAYGYPQDEYPQQVMGVVLSEHDEALDEQGKLALAMDMLFDDEYRKSKDAISDSMQKCLDELVEIIDEKKIENASRMKRQVVIEHILTVMMIVILLGIVMLTRYLMLIPLKRSIEKIREEKVLDVKGAYEMRFLARTYNLMNRVSRESKEKLEYEATHDPITGLYNRRGYDFLLNNVDIYTSAFLLIDLDKFKSINDNYGHDVGDKALTKVAKILHKSFRAQDYVCRIGGDEFAVIMIHAESQLTGRIQNKIREINEQLKIANKDEGVPPISLSVGVVFGDQNYSIDEIFKEADKALYKAKEDANRAVVFAEAV
ncbi:MAG: diguanylate cyclase [Lachnospiraceae bacterium]|nr:diguanylate cyclase [Lachnospiraceae bacterium]